MGKVVLGQITQNLCDSETRRQSKAREALSGGELAQQAWGLPQNAWRATDGNARNARLWGGAVCMGFDGEGRAGSRASHSLQRRRRAQGPASHSPNTTLKMILITYQLTQATRYSKHSIKSYINFLRK